jgi:ribosome biogenesis GTPase / thiamine phosphate phosphatase
MHDDQFPTRGRKEGKEERKRASARDRSKFKKSNLDQAQKRLDRGGESASTGLTGRVLSVTGLEMEVSCEEEILHCVLRGTLKQERSRMRRLVTVGDIVNLERTTLGEGVIVQVAPRRTLLERADPLNPRKRHLIAANIDQVLITGSVVSPPLKPTLIDRYLISAEQGGMEPIIVINKIDLLSSATEAEREEYRQFLLAYQAIGYAIVAVSAITGDGMDTLLELMKGKASVFSGQSGTGKSSLINKTLGTNLLVGEVVEKTRKGAHTTTTARLIPLATGGWCIDTPGVKSFGLLELNKEAVRAHFREIAEVASRCHFPNCSHTHEPDCAVLEAVEEGALSQMRYISYCALLSEIEEKWRAR